MCTACNPGHAASAARVLRPALAAAGATLMSCGLEGEWRIGRKGDNDVFQPALPFLQVGLLQQCLLPCPPPCLLQQPQQQLVTTC
jgi:hypothetical protein